MKSGEEPHGPPFFVKCLLSAQLKCAEWKGASKDWGADQLSILKVTEFAQPFRTKTDFSWERPIRLSPKDVGNLSGLSGAP